MHNTLQNKEMKRCVHCQQNYFPKTKHDEHCDAPKPAEKRTITNQELLAEFKKLQDKVSKMENEITRLRMIVHKNPKLKDIINTLNTSRNFPYMRIFDKWYKEFPSPSIDEVDSWFPKTEEDAERDTKILHTKFVEFVANTWENTLNLHPPLYCNVQQRDPKYFVFDVEDVKRGWRTMKQPDWMKMVETIYNQNVYRVCAKWLFANEEKMSNKLYMKCEQQINQLMKHELAIIMDIKRCMASAVAD